MFVSLSPRFASLRRAIAVACLAVVIGWIIVPVASARPPIVYGFGDPDDERAPDHNLTAGSDDLAAPASWWDPSVVWFYLRVQLFSGFCFVCFR